jgi:hypothetical protein
VYHGQLLFRFRQSLGQSIPFGLQIFDLPLLTHHLAHYFFFVRLALRKLRRLEETAAGQRETRTEPSESNQGSRVATHRGSMRGRTFKSLLSHDSTPFESRIDSLGESNRRVLSAT